MTRAFLIVMDSVGCGGAPDAAEFGDAGANTLGHIALACAEGRADQGRVGPLHLPNLDALAAVEASGIPFTVVGDANQPGDFLSVLRDASMVGLALGMQPVKQEPMA